MITVKCLCGKVIHTTEVILSVHCECGRTVIIDFSEPLKCLVLYESEKRLCLH